MMERRSVTAIEIFAPLIGGPIAVLVVFFWLRELDLTFLATYRMIVLPFVLLAGVLIGIALNQFETQQVANMSDAARRKWEQTWSKQRRGAWWMLIIGIVVAVAYVPSAILNFWQAAGQSPLVIPTLTRTLAVLLWWTTFATHFVTQGLISLRVLQAQRATQQSAPGEA